MKVDDKQHPTPDQGGAANWQYAAEPQAAANYMTPVDMGQTPQEVEWTASEFVAHNKGLEWYAALGVGAVVLAALIYVLTHDTVSAIIIVFVALLLGIAATRKPRVLHYQVNDHGLGIGQKFYPYSEFKSFAVMEEGAFSSITFLPLKRFMPPISIYYAPEDEERIVQVLAFYLPMEMRTHDAIDRLIRRIRF
jgi:hypothetical protein